MLPDLRLGARDCARLARLQAQSPVALPPATWAMLAAAYTAPGRHYHTLEHLDELATLWRAHAWEDPRSAWLALLFHDVVYSAVASDNEARSARLLAALGTDTERAERMILLTAKHGADAGPLDADAATFLDHDLAILAAPRARFRRYEAQVAQEYIPFIGAEAFATGRRAFLERMLSAPRLFYTDAMHAQLDSRARKNLRSALAA